MYKVTPNVPISGVGTYAADWASAWVDLDLKQPKFLTFHNSELTGCSTGLAADQPTMAPSMRDCSSGYHSSSVLKENAANMPIWVAETGISACIGGNETAKTYASAPWSADYALGSAQVGVSQLEFHGPLIICKGGGPPRSVVCFDGECLKPTGEMQP